MNSDYFVTSGDSGIYCRSDCLEQAEPAASVRVLAPGQQLSLKPCSRCHPDMKVEKSIIDLTVKQVNSMIGLDLGVGSPESHSDNGDDVRPSNASFDYFSTMELGSGPASRRATISNGHIAAAVMAVDGMQKHIATGVSKKRVREKTRDDRHRSEGDHVKLVDDACRQIAAAAAVAVLSHKNEEKGSGEQRRRRRGGIMGFKELAAKAGLSPWHFHRVFRSLTGLTPKAYGDACWAAVTSAPSGQSPVQPMTPVSPASVVDSSSSASIESPLTLSSEPLTSPQHVFKPVGFSSTASSTLDENVLSPSTGADFSLSHWQPEFNHAFPADAVSISKDEVSDISSSTSEVVPDTLSYFSFDEPLLLSGSEAVDYNQQTPAADVKRWVGDLSENFLDFPLGDESLSMLAPENCAPVLAQDPSLAFLVPSWDWIES